METVAITLDNLVRETNREEGITLLTGIAYTKGMLVVLQDTGKYTNALIVLSGVAASTPQVSYDEQKVFVLTEDHDATAGDVEAVGFTGRFNRAEVTFSGAQTEAQTVGILQNKDIILEDWSK